MQITINGKNINASNGTSILQACKDNNIKIPTLCSINKKEPRAVCRLCSVEVDGDTDNLLSSCSTPVRPGMVIKTNTDDIHLMRKLLIQLILKEHGKCGQDSCEIELLAHELDVPVDEITFNTNDPQVRMSSDFIHANRELCIHCDRCWTACERDVISKIRIDGQCVFDFKDENCVYCGDCVKACPAQALSLSDKL